MPHKYANFSDAYADLAAGYDDAKTNLDSAVSHQDSAYKGASDPVDKLHFGYLCEAVRLACVSIKYITNINPDDYLQAYLYESIYWAAQGNGNGDVTMDAILTAMITADFDQLQKFTGLVDAYRVALWNEPFNADFYAALARGFTP